MNAFAFAFASVQNLLLMTHSRVLPKVTCVSGDLHCVLGEGPIYDERTDTLYFVDINSSHVYAIASVTGVVAGTVDTEECVPSRVFTCPDGEPASCVFLTMDPRKLVVGTTRYIRLVDLDLDPMAENGAGNASIIATLPDSIGAVDEGARFNDGKVTPSGGHLVIGHLSLSWRNGPMGGLAVLDGKTRKFEDITPPQGIGCPNGIVWRDGKFLIVDSRDESVRAYGTWNVVVCVLVVFVLVIFVVIVVAVAPDLALMCILARPPRT